MNTYSCTVVGRKKTMVSGIYKIRNTKNGKFYIGSARNIKHRWHDHKRNLNNKTHSNIKLQLAWNKYGKENFEFDILEECKTEHLLKLEQVLLDMWAGKQWCYNIALDSMSPMLGRKTSDETKKKMRLSHLGKIRSDIHKKHLSESLTGNKLSKKTKDKLRQLNLGKIDSLETRNKKSLSWRGKTNNPNKQLNEEKVLFIKRNYVPTERGNRGKLAKQLSVSYKSVCDVIYENTWTHINLEDSNELS